MDASVPGSRAGGPRLAPPRCPWHECGAEAEEERGHGDGAAGGSERECEPVAHLPSLQFHLPAPRGVDCTACRLYDRAPVVWGLGWSASCWRPLLGPTSMLLA